MVRQRKALIVANSDYEHDGLRDLSSPAADAQALADVLGAPDIGDFDVQVISNEPAHVIHAHIEEFFADSRADDVLLLHFSCHGLKNESGELFFAATNTRPSRLGSSAVSADFIQRCMRTSRSRRIVLFLDCCYGGAFSKGVSVRASGDVNVLENFPGEGLDGGRGRAVITASNAMEYAFEGNHLADGQTQPSVFTTALVAGLTTGEADRDEDGWVSLNELYDYIFDKVREHNPHQTPSRDIQMQGELYLARSRRHIHTLPIPADLQAAMVDANMFTRLGAVTELRSRLFSDDLPAAAGARDALTEMVRTNTAYVAEPAAAALRQAVVRTMEHQLHFGQVTKGSSSPRRAIHLLGPPLARACTFQTSHNWIRLSQTGQEVEVYIDTAEIGALQGSITIKGPAGEVVIPVDVEVTPEREEQPSSRSTPVNISAPEPTRSTDPHTPTPLSAPPSIRDGRLFRVWNWVIVVGFVLLIVAWLAGVGILWTLGLLIALIGIIVVTVRSIRHKLHHRANRKHNHDSTN